MTKANRTRRANRARSVAAHRRGTPQASPHWGARFDAWLAGEHWAAKVGKKSHHDLDRGHERTPATRERQYRIPSVPPPGPLPARQARWHRTPGAGSGLPRLHETEGVKSPYYVAAGTRRSATPAPVLSVLKRLNALFRRAA